MQRIRMSLPYFKLFGWDVEVVTVDEAYSDIVKDSALLQSIPPDIKVHKIKALNKRWTSKIGLGSIALRSLPFYRKKVNQLLKERRFDLIYFSTTQFPVCILGAYWKKKFGVPYVIDMQDPWHSDYYLDKPKDQRPAKYWFSYRLNKYLEPVAMKHVAGLISVSEEYVDELRARYPVIENIPAATITFSAFATDMDIAERNRMRYKALLDPQFTNIVYIGRGGDDMRPAISILLKSLKSGLNETPGIFGKIRLYFIGTSYATNGQGIQTVAPLAEQVGLQGYVFEMTARIDYYHTLITLQQANALFIPGSDDPKYTASKIYPYLLTKKPLLAIFNSKSPALDVLKEYKAKYAFSYNSTPGISQEIKNFLINAVNGTMHRQQYSEDAISKYSAQNMTKRQCILFDRVCF